MSFLNIVGICVSMLFIAATVMLLVIVIAFTRSIIIENELFKSRENKTKDKYKIGGL